MTARTAIAAIAYDKMIVKSWDFAFECLVVSTASLALSSKVDILTSYVRVRMRASKKFHAARAIPRSGPTRGIGRSEARVSLKAAAAIAAMIGMVRSRPPTGQLATNSITDREFGGHGCLQNDPTNISSLKDYGVNRFTMPKIDGNRWWCSNVMRALVE